MFSHSILIIRVTACMAALALPGVANAQQVSAFASAGEDVTSETPFGSPAIQDSALQTIAGREDTSQVATATQTAGVSRNSVGDNSTTGDARVTDNAFQNLSGLSILNVNTGNNVAINAAMNVNITITPGR